MKKVLLTTALLAFIHLLTTAQSAVFTSDSPRCLNDTMHFTPAAPGGNILMETWDFGDGNVTTFVPPATFPVYATHLYAATGTYQVNRTVKFDTGILSYSLQVQVVARPLPNFANSPATCAAQPVQFNDLSQINGGGAIVVWNWNFGDPSSGANNTSSLQNVSHTFSAAGTFNVSLTVTNSNGCSGTIIKPVTISIQPVANYTTSGQCAGSPVQFIDMSVANAPAIVSYSWDFGDGGTSTLSSPSHVYAYHGLYMVSLTVVNSNGCSHTVIKPVTIAAKPVSAFLVSQGACMGTPVNFWDMSFVPAGFSSFIVQYSWEFGDGTPPLVITFPSNPSVTHTFAGSALTYLVRLTVTTNQGCSSYSEQLVTVVPAPLANFTTFGSLCNSQPVQFTDLSQSNGGGAIALWHWDFGDPASGTGNISSLQNPVHLFNSPGTYSVSLVISNTAGCQDTIYKAVPVGYGPTANFVTDTVPVGTATSFNNLSWTPSGVLTGYSWDFGDPASGSSNYSFMQNPVHLYGLPGVYTVHLTVTSNNGCTHDTLRPVVVIDTVSGPPATRTLNNIIVGNGEVKCYNATQVIATAGNGTLFIVVSGGSATFISGQKIQFLPGTTFQPGSYVWGYIAPGGPWCAFPSLPSVTRDEGERVSGRDEAAIFTVFPNPTGGEFTLDIKADGLIGPVVAEVYDMTGTRVIHQAITGSSNQVFSLAESPAGVYLLRVVSGNRAETARIIRR